MKQIDEHKQALIEGYFAGELSEEEKTDYLRSLANPDFREAVTFHRQLMKVLQKERNSHPLMKIFQEEEKKITEAEPVLTPVAEPVPAPADNGKVVPLWRRMAVAASVLVLLTTAYFGYEFLFPSPTPLAQEFAELPLMSREAGSETTLNLEQGKADFFKGRYDQAIKNLSGVSDDSEDYPEAGILLAYSHFKQEKYEEAIQGFDRFLTDETLFSNLPDRYRDEDQIRWNRMLAYYETGQTAEMQRELDRFLGQTAGSFFRIRADRFRDALEGEG